MIVSSNGVTTRHTGKSVTESDITFIDTWPSRFRVTLRRKTGHNKFKVLTDKFVVQIDSPEAFWDFSAKTADLVKEFLDNDLSDSRTAKYQLRWDLIEE